MMRWIRKARGLLARPPRDLAMFVMTSLAGRGVGIGCQLLQVPIVVKALGAEAFGLWMAMTSLTTLVMFADLGLGVGVQNRVAEALTPREETDARTLLGSAFLFLCGVGALLGLVFAAVIARLDFAAVFRLTDAATIADAPVAAAVVATAFCAGLPFGLAQRFALGKREGWKYNCSQASGNLLGLVLVALGAARGWGLPALVAVSLGSVWLGNVALMFALLRRWGWLGRWLSRFDRAGVRSLLRMGAHFGVQQVLGTLLVAMPQVVISTTLGAGAVTPYNLLQRFFNLFAVVQNSFMLPLWPGYAQARARREFAWMRRTLRRSCLATAFCSILPMAVGACFAPVIVRLWIGREVDGVTPALIALLWLWNALSFAQQPFAYLLTGVSEVERMTRYSVASALTATVLMFALAGPLGPPGVCLGLILGFLPFNVLGNVVETRRYLRRAGAPDFKPLVATS